MDKYISVNSELLAFCGAKAQATTSSGQTNQTTVKEQQTSNPVEKAGQLNLLNINPIETLRNIQALFQIRQNFNVNNLVESGEFLSGAKEIPMVVPEPSIATDSEGKPWDFLPGYIPHESIEPGKTVRVKEATWIVINDKVIYLEIIPIENNQAVLKIPGKDEKGLPLLESGKIEVVKVKSAVSDSGYEGIRTPNGTVVSVQTHYLVSYDQKKNQTTVVVYEGKVEVKTNDGKVTTITPNGGKPGVVVIAQKLSFTKIALAGLIAAAVIGGVVFLLKKRGIKALVSKKKNSR